mmetsp:Transcript_9345/g.36478  ORF Transcript_9345/g.36478 Transcript_9345/m.36478 type:complete len:493 (-) Transcript_9345:186-1664(-)
MKAACGAEARAPADAATTSLLLPRPGVSRPTLPQYGRVRPHRRGHHRHRYHRHRHCYRRRHHNKHRRHNNNHRRRLHRRRSLASPRRSATLQGCDFVLDVEKVLRLQAEPSVPARGRVVEQRFRGVLVAAGTVRVQDLLLLVRRHIMHGPGVRRQAGLPDLGETGQAAAQDGLLPRKRFRVGCVADASARCLEHRPRQHAVGLKEEHAHPHRGDGEEHILGGKARASRHPLRSAPLLAPVAVQGHGLACERLAPPEQPLHRRSGQDPRRSAGCEAKRLAPKLVEKKSHRAHQHRLVRRAAPQLLHSADLALHPGPPDEVVVPHAHDPLVLRFHLVGPHVRPDVEHPVSHPVEHGLERVAHHAHSGALRLQRRHGPVRYPHQPRDGVPPGPVGSHRAVTQRSSGHRKRVNSSPEERIRHSPVVVHHGRGTRDAILGSPSTRRGIGGAACFRGRARCAENAFRTRLLRRRRAPPRTHVQTADTSVPAPDVPFPP